MFAEMSTWVHTLAGERKWLDVELANAGKAIAMLFLAFQVSASGGFLPVELSGSLYAHISPWLPMTWVVMGVKALPSKRPS